MCITIYRSSYLKSFLLLDVTVCNWYNHLRFENLRFCLLSSCTSSNSEGLTADLFAAIFFEMLSTVLIPIFLAWKTEKKRLYFTATKKRQDRNRVTTKSNRHVLIIWLTLIRLSLQKSTLTIWDHMFNIVTWRTKYHTDQQLFPQSYTVLIIALNIIKPAMFIYLSIIKLNYHYPSIIIFLVAKLVKIVYCVDQMTKHFKSFLPIIVPCWLFDCIWLEGVGVPNRDPFALPKRCCKYPCESRQSWDLAAPFYQMVVL